MSRLQQQLNYSNVPAWHEAGITGKGVNVMNLETPGGDGHCEACTARVKHAAPDATVYETGLTLTTSNGTVTATCKWQGKRYDVEDFIKEFNIKIVIRSVAGSIENETLSLYWGALKTKHNLIFVTPIGNDGTKDAGGAFPADIAILVGACSITDSGSLTILNFSGRHKELEFVNFMGNLNGTSFSAPYTAGMIALYLQKYGIERTQDEAFECLKSHRKDIGEPGHDKDSGWGIPVMGDPYEEGEVMVSEKTKADFINKIGQMAQADMQKSGILASLTIAQAILESYWGQSGLTRRANNLFGIKGSYNGKTTIAGTQEYYGQWVTINAGFRVYPNWEESIADHSKLFNTLSRYANLRGLKDYKLACEYVQKDGYATDPNYASKSKNLIETYKLYQYDKVVEDLTKEETLALIKEVLTGKSTEAADWAKESWEEAKEAGITDGTNPKGYVTREQVITMIDRAFESGR